MGQPIVGSNPTLSARSVASSTAGYVSHATVSALEMATFTFAVDEPQAGEQGVVMAYIVRYRSGVLLFDTGFGFGSPLVDERYRPLARHLPVALAEHGLEVGDLDAAVNCHLHIDHAGQNRLLAGIPIHAQRKEWQLVQAGGHTINEWVDFEGADYRLHDGDYELAPDIRVVATPGHTAGHQSLAVDTAEGLVILAGQACYSAEEWAGLPGAREGLTRAPDKAAYRRSLDRLRSMSPAIVLFGHDRSVWRAPAGPHVESDMPC
jgi:N-acyl homoserine lactone hydrolase